MSRVIDLCEDRVIEIDDDDIEIEEEPSNPTRLIRRYREMTMEDYLSIIIRTLFPFCTFDSTLSAIRFDWDRCRVAPLPFDTGAYYDYDFLFLDLKRILEKLKSKDETMFTMDTIRGDSFVITSGGMSEPCNPRNSRISVKHLMALVRRMRGPEERAFDFLEVNYTTLATTVITTIRFHFHDVPSHGSAVIELE